MGPRPPGGRPHRVEGHLRSPLLPAGRATRTEAWRAAHARRLRIAGFGFQISDSGLPAPSSATGGSASPEGDCGLRIADCGLPAPSSPKGGLASPEGAEGHSRGRKPPEGPGPTEPAPEGRKDREIACETAGGPSPALSMGPHGRGASRGPARGPSRGCLCGLAVAFVSHKGEVFPCGYLPVDCGSVRQRTLAEIWRDSDVFADLRDFERLTGKCGRCEFKGVCGGCRARAYALTGKYLAAEPACTHRPRP